MKSVWYYDYPIGRIGIAEENGALCHVFLSGSKILTGFSTAQTPLIQEAARQLGEYFDGRRKEFDLPLSLHGTEFQQSVWEALQAIPVGETRSYKEIAVQIETHARAALLVRRTIATLLSLLFPATVWWDKTVV